MSLPLTLGRTQIRAIRSYLIEEVSTQKLHSTADHLVVSPEEELAEFETSIALNAAWNAQIAAERQVRLDKQLAERKKYILTRLELKEERDRAAREQTEETVRREKVYFCVFLHSARHLILGSLRSCPSTTS